VVKKQFSVEFQFLAHLSKKNTFIHSTTTVKLTNYINSWEKKKKRKFMPQARLTRRPKSSLRRHLIKLERPKSYYRVKSSQQKTLCTRPPWPPPHTLRTLRTHLPRLHVFDPCVHVFTRLVTWRRKRATWNRRL